LAIPKELSEIEGEALEELQDIQKRNRQEAITGYKLLSGFWDKFYEKYDELDNAIAFIKKVWWYRLYGYWFWNDGKPTYITGRHFMWLNFFWMPDVRDNGGFLNTETGTEGNIYIEITFVVPRRRLFIETIGDGLYPKRMDITR